MIKPQNLLPNLSPRQPLEDEYISETDGLICGGAVEIIDDFHKLLCLLHDVCPFREKETGNF